MTNPPSDILEACPFCGGKADVERSFSGGPYILCGTCGAATMFAETKAAARKLWNTRTPSPQWQEIATAPKDGTRVLLYVPAITIIIGRGDSRVHPAEIGTGSWVPGEGRGWYCDGWRANSATHWMPLPPAPSDSGRHRDGEDASASESEACQSGPKASPITTPLRSPADVDLREVLRNVIDTHDNGSFEEQGLAMDAARKALSSGESQ